MTVHCILLDHGRRLTRLTAYSSERKRDLGVENYRGRLICKFSAPDMDSIKEFLAEEAAKHGGSVGYSKPQRRSIAWGEMGIRLNAVLTYPRTSQ